MTILYSWSLSVDHQCWALASCKYFKGTCSGDRKTNYGLHQNFSRAFTHRTIEILENPRKFHYTDPNSLVDEASEKQSPAKVLTVEFATLQEMEHHIGP